MTADHGTSTTERGAQGAEREAPDAERGATGPERGSPYVGREASTAGQRASTAERVQALLALLPALVLAWPFGGPLAADLAPRSSGFGLATLCAVPGVLWFLARRAAPAVRGSLLVAVPLAASALWLGFGAPLDPFEAERATLGWALVLASFLCGASADPRTLAHVSAALAAILALGALPAPHAGALGNAGATSEAATLGAGAALVLAAAAGRAPIACVLGLAALAAFLLHAARAPVVAGGVAVLAAAAALVVARTRDRVRSGVLVAACVLACAAPFTLPRATSTRDARGAPAVVDTGPASGGSVRLALHASSAALLAAHPLGVGPGQFPAQFPPFRAPAEIEASSHRRLQAAETEVEHAHDDWIQPALELGVPVGLAWLAFLVLVVAAAWRALRSDDDALAALGAGAVAFLVHALARAPVTSNAAAATMFAAVAGALLARRAAAPPGVARRASAIVTMLVLLAFAPRALAFVRHGAALGTWAALSPDDPEGRERALRDAALAAPDSVLVRTLEARSAELLGEPPAHVAARWDGVLVVRPHRVEALVQKASAAARAGDVAAARAALEHALRVDPGNPPALQNLASLLLQDGELERGLALLDRIPPARAPQTDWLRGLAARLALAGLEEESVAITARAEPERTGLTAEALYQLASALRARGEDLPADGFEARAHRAWAAEHAAAGRWNECVRSVRQELRLAAERPERTPVRVRLALSAALARAGRGAEARAEHDALDPFEAARHAGRVPAWARP